MKRTKSYILAMNPLPAQGVAPLGTRFYDKNIKEITYCGLELLRQHGNEPFYTGPVYLDITFYMKPHQQKKRDLSYHAIKPPLSHLVEFVVRTLIRNEILADDKIICQQSVQKKWDFDPRTEITIMEL